MSYTALGLAFVLGFILGRIETIISLLRGRDFSIVSTGDGYNNNRNFVSKDQTKKKIVSIDESKFVTDVEINYEKNFDQELGDKSTTNDDIMSAAQKLAQLKRGK